MPKKKPKRGKMKARASGTAQGQEQASMARWPLCSELTAEQLRAMTPAQKIAEWERLTLLAREIGWDKKQREEEVQQVRETWARLRKAWRERQQLG